MKSERKIFEQYLTKKHFPDGPLEFIKILEKISHEAFGKEAMESIEYAHKTHNRHWNNLLKMIYNDEKRGIIPIFKIIDKESKILEYNKKTKKRLKRNFFRDRVEILQYIDSIDDREYESLCCVALKALGANNILLTPSGNEGGIDFVGTIKFSKNSHFLFGINGPIKIIGQAKFYGNPVTVKEIKEFDSTINDIQRLAPKTLDILPDWFKKEKGPIIGWFVAHSAFQSGANDRSKNFGFINSDSRDLGEILSKSKHLKPNIPVEQRIKELEKEVKYFLNLSEYRK